MEIKLVSLPSMGYKSNLPEVFNMEPFGPAQFPLMAKAAETDDKRYLLQDALDGVLDIDVGRLSIQDAHALVFQQRLLSSSVRPLSVGFKCLHPIFEYDFGTSTSYLPDDILLGQHPCNTSQHAMIDASSLEVSVLNAQHTEFDLPRMEYYTEASESLFHWAIAHHSSDFHRSLHHFETQGTLDEFTALTLWVEQSQHGLLNSVTCSCASCGKTNKVLWDMPARIFML